MRKILVSMMVSADGFIEDSNKELSAFKDDEEVLKYFEDLLDSVDIIMFGRRAYELMLDYWPKATGPIAEKMNKKSKIVFSRTLSQVSWNTKLIKNNIAEEIMKLRNEPGKDIVLYAGAEILSTFRKLGLVEEYRLAVYPVVLGKGTPLFKDVEHTMSLKLINTKKFKSGVVLLTYQPQHAEELMSSDAAQEDAHHVER
jgi:dihydrofolate reductase